MTTTPDTVKQRAHAVIDGLPDDAKWNDIVEALAVIEDVDDPDAGGGSNVIDLMAALKKSVGEEKPKKTARRKKSA